MDITSKMVRELREATGAGMMDCKKALTATGGDHEQAVDFLRKKGLKSAEKKASRDMGEGRVTSSVSSDGSKGCLVAISCETDFAATTPDMEEFLSKLCDHVLEHNPSSVAELLGQNFAGTDADVETALKSVVGKLGENISIVDIACYTNDAGAVAAYIHHNNRVGVLVNATTKSKGDTAAGTLKSLGMHIAALKPACLNRDEMPADEVEREKAIYMDEVKSKPENIQEKIVAGKLEKFFAERALVEQAWVLDDKLTVAKAMVAALGDGTTIDGFKRFEV